MAGEPDLQANQSGQWVQYLQQLLNHHYQTSVVAESGDFDDATAAAVEHLRAQNGLGSGSGVDAAVWGVLTGEGAATPAATTTTPAAQPDPSGSGAGAFDAGAGDAGGAAQPAADRNEGHGSSESRERDREIQGGTRQHHPGDMSSWFQSDWAGSAILARWLAGDGDWYLDHDPTWTAYMQANPGLKHKLAQHAHYVVANAAALGDDEGVIDVNEQYHVDLENGEGIVGYQYLHGSNATVGDFQITGWVRLVPSAAPPGPDDNQTSAHRRVHWYLEYHWNDMIDPNAQYGTDVFKSAIGYFISMGSATDYRITIVWSGEGVATVDGNGQVLELADHSDSGAAVDGYPLR